MMEKALLVFRHYMLSPVVSWFVNFLWWCASFDRFPQVREIVEFEGKRLTDMDAVVSLMSRFEWRKEDVDWTPWIETIFDALVEDDCDGAAVLGKWALEKIGIRARVYHLWRRGDKSGHDVCISDDHSIMISNSDVVELGENWTDEVKRYFGGRFDMIQDGWRFV